MSVKRNYQLQESMYAQAMMVVLIRIQEIDRRWGRIAGGEGVAVPL